LFIFDEDKVVYSPADETIRTLVDENRWNYLLIKFMDWLRCLKREIPSAGKWSEPFDISKRIIWKVAEGDNSDLLSRG
jgi:hypothetical protein